MEISKAQLKELTDSRSWQRGQDYHRQGRAVWDFELVKIHLALP